VERSIIIDLQRQKYFIIPTVLCNILNDRTLNEVGDVIKKYPSIDRKRIISWFRYLELKDLVFFRRNFQKFPELDNSIIFSSLITNAIIDVCYQDNV
jgi:hypothetical protein